MLDGEYLIKVLQVEPLSEFLPPRFAVFKGPLDFSISLVSHDHRRACFAEEPNRRSYKS